MINKKYIELFKDEERTTKVVEEILEKGCVLLDDFLEPDFLKELQSLERKSREYTLGKNESLEGTSVERFARSDAFMHIFQEVHRLRCKIEGVSYEPLETKRQFFGLAYKNAVDGKKAKETPFHYDAAYVNTVTPIILPEDGEDGGLVAFPNLRKKIPTRLLSGIVSRIFRHSRFLRSFFGARVPYKTNSLVLFFGDITFHGVDPIKSGERLVMTINAHW